MQSTWNARSNFMVTYHKEIIMLVINLYKYSVRILGIEYITKACKYQKKSLNADSRACLYYDKR